MKGYMVKLENCEMKVETPKAIEGFIEFNALHSAILDQDGYYTDIKSSNGYTYYNILKHSDKLVNAIWLGHFENQDTIYDIENDCVIKL